jgi:hypothetical protein
LIKQWGGYLGSLSFYVGHIMVTFRCKWSNNLLNVEYEYDIAQMRTHPDYEEVKEEVKKEETNKKVAKNAKED